ncbi:hypothetical protein KAK07_21895 [Ideonella sp. 4Y16]|uniref:Lipoprotein n=1 Tax=Ideonella alba TaxID=2824118 RepID=A0A940Y790_9BURK|nr:hypothetical protein [Ideonella alba]MBQ0929976.1 hypothetical protein [Ideonella alba]MBQ0946010.1 hypothetical protein [Ideonella alba]
MRRFAQSAPALILVAALMSGCASHYLAAAESEQQAADDLRRAGAGATTAASDAQSRANRSRQAARCQDALACTLDVIGQVVLSVFLGDVDGR